MSTEMRWCGPCQAEQLFELPPCEDGHGFDCPDLACVECGAAIVVGVLLPAVAAPLVRHATAA